jgi:AbrB family looped-hinge helix DNA binding protein
MVVVRIGKRGTLVIPSKERKKGGMDEGDKVDVTAEGTGVLIIKRVFSLNEVQRRMAGRLPQWSELEGKADHLLERESPPR